MTMVGFKRPGILFLLLFSSVSFANQKLIVVGGGVAPEAAYQKFVNWGNGNQGHFLMVTWSTEDPEGGLLSFKDRLSPYYKDLDHVEVSPPFKEMDLPSAVQLFEEELQRATGVYFSGGDQDLFMKVVERHRDFKKRLLSKYFNGEAVMMGTSAGTAIVSDPMIDGDLDHPEHFWTEEGLGLLPGIFLDQHFFVRNREPRLKAAMIEKKVPLGLGVDEDSAVVIENNTRLTVFGDRTGRPNALLLDQLVEEDNKKVDLAPAPARIEFWPGDTWDLSHHPHRTGKSI